IPAARRTKIRTQLNRLQQLLPKLEAARATDGQGVSFGFDADPKKNEIIAGDSDKSLAELYAGFMAPPQPRQPAATASASPELQAWALPGGLRITPLTGGAEIQRCELICAGVIVLAGLLLAGCRSERRRRPSGTATPNTGISVSWNGNTISIRARIQVSGPGASQPIADALKRDIERVWNARFSDGYSSTCQVDISLGGASSDPSAAQIIVGIGGTVDQSYTLGSTMYFMYSGDPNDLVWSPAHEFAHLLGLSDRRRSSLFGNQPETSDPGYERNIMGAIPGGRMENRTRLVLESRNIRDWLDHYAR